MTHTISSITGVLKHTIDWVSRSAPGEAELAAFTGKVAALVSASPGGLAGLRALIHVRALLENIGVLVLPDQLSVPRAHAAFTPEGALQDATQQTRLERLTRRLADVIRKLDDPEAPTS